MRSMCAFIKKEVKEQLRSGKLMILGILFVLFGIMNPAVAKLTPWMLEVMADSLAESGMIVTNVNISAMDSWVQFFKNIPMGLIAFVLMENSIFIKEYQTGTLLLTLTKGLKRSDVVIAKTVVLTVLWTIYYFICAGITYGYNAYFWDNSMAKNLMFSLVCWWVFGLWINVLTVLFSTIFRSSAGVLMGTGSVVIVFYVLGLFPGLNKYIPTLLMKGTSLIYAMAEKDAYSSALIIAFVMICAGFGLSIPIFNKKQL